MGLVKFSFLLPLNVCVFWLLARSDSPATRKRGLVSVDYSQGSKAKEASSGSSFLISMNDFTLLRVIGRGSYAKVLLVSNIHSPSLDSLYVFPYISIILVLRISSMVNTSLWTPHPPHPLAPTQQNSHFLNFAWLIK